MKKSILLTIVLLFTSVGAWSQQVSDASAVNFDNTETRPSVALVLSGAGAKGFAHIAVIELIEELGIPIDIVIGTSSGAIVGGLYSAGYSGKEIAENMVYVDWPTLLQDATVHPLESAMGSHSSESNLINLQLTNDFSLNLGRGLLSGQYVYNKIKELTVKIPSYTDFDDLPTPYRAAAVDLLTGELVMIDSGDLTEAIRSSMSIPGAFEPFPVDNRYFLDGFIKDNFPVEAAKDLGYDIIIAVDMTDKMVENADAFKANPIIALNQILALQQATVTTTGYELADLVLFPDLSEFGQMDYGSAPEVYEKGKLEVEKYREALITLRDTVFPEISNPETTVNYSRQTNYDDLPEIFIDDIEIENALLSDEKMIINVFTELKKLPFGGEEINYLLEKAYNTGNYIMVTSRINMQGEKSILELEFYQKDLQGIQVANNIIFEGSLSQTATWEITFSTVLQFKNLNDLGGVLSLDVAFLNNSNLEVMFLQPLSENIFLRAKANVVSNLDIENSGFENIAVRDSQFRHATFALAGGVFFTPEHKLLNEVGVHWIDSTQAQTDEINKVVDVRNLKFAYTVDAYTRYTIDTLDFSMFPTKGFYNDLYIMGVVPIGDEEEHIPFDVLSTNMVAAIPFNENMGIVFNGFMGTNITEQLSKKAELITKYGFTTYDRTFFPHVMQRYVYGIHKLAVKTDLQFKPSSQLTILGGQFLTGVSGAIGGVWDSYDSLIAFDDIDWQSSAYAGIRIKDSIGIILRAGAGNYSGDVVPFVALDLMVKSY